jgi:hypothetical protein
VWIDASFCEEYYCHCCGINTKEQDGDGVGFLHTVLNFGLKEFIDQLND